MNRVILLAGLAAFATGPALAQGKVQGVTKNEIVLGGLYDLSGPAAVWGVGTRNGMGMRFDAVNEQGGIHGRKIKLI
ncbi:MAG: hypothetical protein FJX47_04095, partial [Alphaproteobacteria bacterium]|nr:hypothetical protein [Alphaproteobacteria bacterium]